MKTWRDPSDDEWIASNVTMDILTNYTCLSPLLPFFIEDFWLCSNSHKSYLGCLTYAMLEKLSLLGIFISNGNSIDSFLINYDMQKKEQETLWTEHVLTCHGKYGLKWTEETLRFPRLITDADNYFLHCEYRLL